MFGIDQPVRIAQVGVGRRSRIHETVIRALPEVFELVAVCDRDGQVAENAAGRLGVKGYTHIRDLLEDGGAEAISVTTPGPSHHAIVCLAADAGVHAITETPISVSRQLADLMITRAADAGVHLEVAENYYRVPMERFWSRVIDDVGAIGPVSRLYRVFQEGGAHGMSLLRTRAGSEPTRVLGIRHSTPVTAITDRMRRHHDHEHMLLSYLDFASGASAVMIYSNVIHARSLGRGQTAISQVDGQAGSIVDGSVHLVPEEELHDGARSQAFRPVRHTRDVGGVTVLDAIELTLPAPLGTVTWENPFRGVALTEPQVAVADALTSLALAVRDISAVDYGSEAGRLDVEMNLAMQQSAASDRRTLPLPLPARTEVEDGVHARFAEQYGCDAFDVDALADVLFPRT